MFLLLLIYHLWVIYDITVLLRRLHPFRPIVKHPLYFLHYSWLFSTYRRTSLIYLLRSPFNNVIIPWLSPLCRELLVLLPRHVLTYRQHGLLSAHLAHPVVIVVDQHVRGPQLLLLIELDSTLHALGLAEESGVFVGNTRVLQDWGETPSVNQMAAVESLVAAMVLQDDRWNVRDPLLWGGIHTLHDQGS